MITAKTFELLEKLSNIPAGTGSRKDKLTILKDNREHLQEYMSIAFHPYRVFHIQKIPKTSQLLHKWIPYSLEELAEYLEKKKGLTNEDKDLVSKSLEEIESQMPGSRKWAEIALLKNLKIGIEVKSLNKAGYDLPEFVCLLADPNKENSLEGIKFPAIIQPKLDGCRVIRMPNGDFFGRNGKVVPNVRLDEHVNIPFEDVVLDGEFFSFSRKFNDIFGYFSSDDEVLPEDVKFVIFNVVTEEEWHKQSSKTEYTRQLEKLELIAQGSKNVIAIPYRWVNSKEEAMEFYRNYLSQGFEGAMVRNADSTYMWERVKVKDGVLTKLKPFDYTDCTITGFYEGKNRHEGRLGGLELDYKGTKVDCGGGFSDKLREELWEKRDTLVGKSCRVKFTEITPDGSLRFPIWDSFRDDK